MNSDKKQTVGYMLFLYRQELRKSKNAEEITKIKIKLTDVLCTKGIRNMKYFSTEKVMALSREMSYKKELMTKLHPDDEKIQIRLTDGLYTTAVRYQIRSSLPNVKVTSMSREYKIKVLAQLNSTQEMESKEEELHDNNTTKSVKKNVQKIQKRT